uniref:Uncharacterized protein n=1 Tax=Pyropia fucicola TaxID=144551 RepID=A0A059XLV3_9RHOD|nr:hypothetical protein [Neopyropia fucicola]
MKWYYDRGYQWSLVEVKQASDASSILIDIHEGVVETIITEYYTLSYKRVSGISYIESIEQYLGVRVGAPLNIICLQKKITYLKDNQLVGDIIYSIERSNNNSMSLDIKFQVQELKDKEIVVLAESSSKTSPIISHACNLLNQYKNRLVASNIISVSTSKLHACYFNCKLDYQYKYINTSNLIKLLAYSISCHKTLLSHYSNLQTLISWTKKNTIGFQLHLRNLSFGKAFCVFSMKFIKNGLNIKILYINPSLIVDQNFILQFAIQIIKQYHTAKPPALFLTNVNLEQYVAESLLVYHFTSCFSISEKILLSRIMHTDSLFFNSENLHFHVDDKTHGINNYDTFKQNTKIFYQEFFSLLLSLRYQNFNYLGWPLKGHFFEIKSLYLAPFEKSDFSNSCKTLFCHTMSLKQVSNFNLPISFRNQLNHILVSTIKCQSNLNMRNVSLRLIDYPAEYMLYKSIFNFSIKVRMQYFIPMSNSIRVSLFYNYLDCFLIRSSQSLIHIWQDLRTHKPIQNFWSKKFSYGFGIQLKLPIKQIPPLSIEYTITSSRYFCIYLRTYYQR